MIAKISSVPYDFAGTGVRNGGGQYEPPDVVGRVLDARTRQPLTDVLVGLSGVSRLTETNGCFFLPSIPLSADRTLVAAQTGYTVYSKHIEFPPGAKLITLEDILLQPVGTNPVVTSLKAKWNGIFLSGIHFTNTFTATINWNTNTPYYVDFYANDTLVESIPTWNSSGSCSFDMSDYFIPSFNSGANRIRVIARSYEGRDSDPVSKEVTVIPLPYALSQLLSQIQVDANQQMNVDFEFPQPPIHAELNLPVIGKFGVDFAANASFDYTFVDGDWEAAFGLGAEQSTGKRGRRPTVPGVVRYPNAKLYIGNKEISGEIEAGALGVATPSRGIELSQCFGRGSISGKFELGRVGLPDLLGPGLSSALALVPGLGDLAKTISVIIYVAPGIEGQANFALDPAFAFKDAELTGKIALEAAYEPDLGICQMRLYLGGEPSVTFQIPGNLIKELCFRAYAGAVFQVWILPEIDMEYVFVNVSVSSHKKLHKKMSTFSYNVSGGQKIVLIGRSIVRPFNREYLKAGSERFVASDSGIRTMTANGKTMSPLKAFRAVGRAPVQDTVTRKSPRLTRKSPHSSLSGDEDTTPITIAYLTIIENAFPYSQPALAARGEELMLLYVTDNGISNALQFTDIKWTRYDGANWSVAAPIMTDTRGEFAPQVTYDGNGDAVAVWERVADTNLTNSSISDMAAQMEIAWSRWDHATDLWTVPSALTSNSCLDCMPLLCGPMMNGDVLLAWTRNEANLLMGTGTVGSVANSQVMWSRWNSGSSVWTPASTLVSNLPYRLSQSLAGLSNVAVYAWTRDIDGVLTNDADQELFYRLWSNGVWGAEMQYATDSVPDKNVRAAVSSAGDVYLVWQKGTNLVIDRNLSRNPTVARADSQSAGFADYAMTLGAGGHLALVWQEMTENGANARYKVYDPGSDTWSKDGVLFDDPSLERSFAPVWDDLGNLTVAYNRVEMFKTNKVVELDGGGSVTISNVPQAGRVDLAVFKHTLIRDLAIQAGDFVVDGRNYLPNEQLTLAACVKNVGDMAVSNIVVAFYDGDPAQWGTLIASNTVPGWFEAGATTIVATTWFVPEPATNRTLYAVIDPAGSVSEFTKTNNTQSVNICRVNLVLSLISFTTETNGAMRVIAQVCNQGVISASNSVLAMRRTWQTGNPLATVPVPGLGPEQLAQLAIDVPAGTQPEGEDYYTLSVDDNHQTGDVDTNNNATTFAVNLWIDNDNDGMPNWWETAKGFNPNNSNDANEDDDHDGMRNYAEWRVGTDPHDQHSYLMVQDMMAMGSDPVTGGFLLTWGSTSNKLYTINRASSLVEDVGFTPIIQHIHATPPENTYRDTSVATNAGPFFYRIEVE